jgi:hypothetical protein
VTLAEQPPEAGALLEMPHAPRVNVAKKRSRPLKIRTQQRPPPTASIETRRLTQLGDELDRVSTEGRSVEKRVEAGLVEEFGKHREVQTSTVSLRSRKRSR